MTGVTQRYVSKELTHFVGRGKLEKEQFSLLIEIIKSKWITHFPHDPNISGNLSINTSTIFSDNDMYNPQMTCFADIPIEDLSMHMNKYSTFGLSFSKDFISNAGGNPVQYLAKKAKVKRRVKKKNSYEYFEKDINKSEYYNEMIKKYQLLFSEFNNLASKANEKPGVSFLEKEIQDLESFFNFHVFSFFKFFDHSKADDDLDNYYFEREWRIIGNLNFKSSDIKTIFLPSKFGSLFRKEIPDFNGQLIFTD